MFFTVDSILILLLSRWPLTRNRTKSFHSRCNELHHLCICQRKELSQSTCPALVHQISPLWPVQGKWVCRAHKAAMWSQHPLQKSWPLTLNLQSLPQDPLQARLPAEEWHGNTTQSCEVSSFPSTCQLQLELVKMAQTIFPLTGFLLIYGRSSPEFPLLITSPFPLESFLSQPRVCKHTYSLLHSLLGMPQGNDPQAQILAAAIRAAFITHIPTGPCFSLCWCSPY